MLSLLAVCALSALSCTNEELTAPHGAQPTVSVNTLITSDTLCARTQFTITSATAVTTLFPSRTSCTTKLVLIRGQAAVWAQNPNRRLYLFVRLLNKSGQTLQMPVRLYLPSTGTTVIAPSGTPASKVVAVTPDSSEAGGGRIWFIGGTGTLAANDSTPQDTIKVNVMSPATQARFQFTATAQMSGGLPPVPAATNWASLTPLLTTFPGDTTYKYRRNMLGVEFDSAAAASSYNNVLSKYSGTLVGGIGGGYSHPYYVIQFPDPGAAWAAFDSLGARIQAEPGVRSILHLSHLSGFRLKGRFPNDNGISSGRADWSGTGTSRTWPWLAVRAPLAWGCETGLYGSAVPKVAVADAFFDLLPGDLAVPSS